MSHKWTNRLRAVFACAALLFGGLAAAVGEGSAAPEIARPGLKWFNVAAPLPIATLKGRVVILDFWTEGCINCIHIIPTLRAVEERFPDRVAVIGVHSPKFSGEKNPASVQDAILRYEIRHPVVHDPDMSIWNAYGVNAWPTLVIIGADGRRIAQVSGEPDADALMRAVTGLVAGIDAGLVEKATSLNLALPEPPQGRFLFPGKLKPVPGDNVRWVLADAGHHQIVLLDDQGKDLRRYGSGQSGRSDGSAAQARFDRPQGLVASTKAIYVADTDNHAIRRIDLASGAVTTLAGTGRRGSTLEAEATPGKTTALASPWDLELRGEQLYFANAGTHQIGVLDLATNTVARLAGSGAEALTDGAPAHAAFAQPSGLGLSPDGNTLYVADAESSAVRAIAVNAGNSSKTLVGAGLFDFGHANGSFRAARLQHPLGVASDGVRVLVADTYNSRVRSLDLAQAQVEDFDGGKFTCMDPICIPPREPAGIVIAAADRVLVVDTGNHRIEEYRPSRKEYRTWAR